MAVMMRNDDHFEDTKKKKEEIEMDDKMRSNKK